MSTILNRLNHELESFGRKAQAAIDEGRLQIEFIILPRQRDGVASDLGRLIYKRERKQDVEQIRIDALMLRMDDLEAAIEKVERQMGSIRAEAYEAPTADQSPTPDVSEVAAAGATPSGAEEGSPS